MGATNGVRAGQIEAFLTRPVRHPPRKPVVRYHDFSYQAGSWDQAPCCVDNQARLQLFTLADNLGKFLRRLALPRSVKHWSLTTLQKKLIEIAEKVVSHWRLWIQMAEVAIPHNLFAAILARIQRLRAVPGMARS
jgi:hypothetical protein